MLLHFKEMTQIRLESKLFALACCMRHAACGMHSLTLSLVLWQTSRNRHLLQICFFLFFVFARIPRNHVAAAEPHPRFQVCVCVRVCRIFSSHILSANISHSLGESNRAAGKLQLTSNFRFVVRPAATKNQFFRLDLSHDLNS